MRGIRVSATKSIGNYFQAHDILGTLYIIYYYLIRILRFWTASSFCICNFCAVSALIINEHRWTKVWIEHKYVREYQPSQLLQMISAAEPELKN